MSIQFSLPPKLFGSGASQFCQDQSDPSLQLQSSHPEQALRPPSHSLEELLFMLNTRSFSSWLRTDTRLACSSFNLG